MLRTLLFVIVAALVQPTIAHACGNEVEWTTNDYVRLVAKAEKLLESGEYGRAKKTLLRVRLPNAALRTRAADVNALISVRTSKKSAELEAAAKHFAARSRAKADDVRLRAWLAEAHLALGKKDEARTILAELHEKDLMPDGHAYLALAKLSTGTARYAFWKACRARVKRKNACELPAEVATKPSSKARS